MTSYREKQKELKAPDELQKLGAQAVPWLEQHGKTVTVTVVVGLVVVGGFFIVRDVGKKSEEKASHGFGAALKVLSRDVNASATAPVAPGDEPPFKSEAAKDEALIDQLTAFRTKNAGTRAAASAALPLAQALLREGKPADALPLLDEYLKRADPSDVLRPSALEARGYAFEAEKKYDDALAAFDQLSRDNKTDFLKGMGLYHRARILELKGDKEGAAKQFAELATVAPDSAAARQAKERLSQLVAMGVAMPAVEPAPAATVDGGH